jgi:hypothetical protein
MVGTKPNWSPEDEARQGVTTKKRREQSQIRSRAGPVRRDSSHGPRSLVGVIRVIRGPTITGDLARALGRGDPEDHRPEDHRRGLRVGLLVVVRIRRRGRQDRGRASL